jgi:hypothetical protein
MDRYGTIQPLIDPFPWPPVKPVVGQEPDSEEAPGVEAVHGGLNVRNKDIQ